MIWRIICGALGLTVLGGTALLALDLVNREQNAEVLLAAYMGIGGLLVGAFLLFYAASGQWRPRLKRFGKRR